MKPFIGIAATLALSAGVVAAQENPEQRNAAMKAHVEIDQMLRGAKVLGVEAGIMGPAVKDAPYSADEIHETNQVLADGTRIHNETKTTIYRDSQGRVRRESPGQVMIWDAANRTSLMLNQSNQTAQKMQMAVNYTIRRDFAPDGQLDKREVRTFRFPESGAQSGGAQILVLRPGDLPPLPAGEGKMPPPPPLAVPLPRPEGQRESLGKQIIEGLNCDGVRTTSTIETGAIGNDRPIQSVEERWYSPELQLNMLVRRTDPRTGEDILRITNVRRLEPDPSLFTVPQGYQVK